MTEQVRRASYDKNLGILGRVLVERDEYDMNERDLWGQVVRDSSHIEKGR